MEKLGIKVLMKEQYDALLKSYMCRKKVCWWHCRQVSENRLSDFTLDVRLHSGGCCCTVGQDSVVIVVSPLSAFMRDQVQKLEGVLNVCVLQSVGEEEGEGKVTIPKDIKKCCLMFGHPEVFDSRTTRMLPKCLKRKGAGHCCGRGSFGS